MSTKADEVRRRRPAFEFSPASSRLPKAVAVTMGPTGRHVVLQKSFGGPAVTKDGVRSPRKSNSPTPSRTWVPRWSPGGQEDRHGGRRDHCRHRARARHLEQGLKHVATGANAVAIQRGINAAAGVACARSRTNSPTKCKKMADLQKVATVSANHDAESGGMIAQAIDTVGADGVVEVEEGKSAETDARLRRGHAAFDKGYLSPYFMTDPGRRSACSKTPDHPDPREEDLEPADLLPLLNKVATDGSRC